MKTKLSLAIVVAVLITAFKACWNIEEERSSLTEVSSSIAESIEKGAFVKTVSLIDRNNAILPHVGEMWVEKINEIDYKLVFIRTRKIRDQHRLILRLKDGTVTSFYRTLRSDDKKFFGIQGRESKRMLFYDDLGDTLPGRLKILVLSDADDVIIDTVEFVL